VSQLEKLKERLLSKPKDFSWDELVKLLGKFGYYEMKTGKTGGSRRKFSNGSDIISLHKPHPNPTLKAYQITDTINHLTEKGIL